LDATFIAVLLPDINPPPFPAELVSY